MMLFHATKVINLYFKFLFILISKCMYNTIKNHVYFPIAHFFTT